MKYFGIWIDLGPQSGLSGWLVNSGGEVMHFPIRSIAEAQLESYRRFCPDNPAEIREFK
jgi:hypothetical protein